MNIWRGRCEVAQARWWQVAGFCEDQLGIMEADSWTGVGLLRKGFVQVKPTAFDHGLQLPFKPCLHGQQDSLHGGIVWGIAREMRRRVGRGKADLHLISAKP